ncbi:MAG: hypothetical protein Q4E47_02680 [Candidatus Saccharibacteria bacterium]|nr:hypothetical protein [Candidatus Saccharibacteria bacterium]
MRKIIKFFSFLVWGALGALVVYGIYNATQNVEGDANNVRVLQLENTHHRKTDMENAVVAVKDYFKKNFFGARLDEIWYGHDYDKEKELEKQFGGAEVIILRSKYMKFTGDEERKWGWIVVKYNEAKMEVQNWGYDDNEKIDARILN